jgi:hypothetical protein
MVRLYTVGGVVSVVIISIKILGNNDASVRNGSKIEIIAGALVVSQKGPVITIFNQYAHIRTGASIHSSLQLEHYNLQVDDRSLHAGGTQCI